MDCDGVLTDGRLYFGENGESFKTFHVRDGQGIVDWHKAGFISGIITGRNSNIVERRANELGIKHLRQGSRDKLADFEELSEEIGFTPDETAYIGDDTPDIPLLKKVGLSFTVADAAKDVFPHVDIVLQSNGGSGAIRELIDWLLKAKSS